MSELLSLDAVRGPVVTAFDSIDCKYQLVNLGYLEDEKLELVHQILQRKGLKSGKRRPPIINHGYFVRVRTVQRYLLNFCNQFTEKRQFIFLGSGFETTPLQLSQRKENFIAEVDFSEVMYTKKEMYSNSSFANNLDLHCFSHWNEIADTTFRRDNHLLIGRDLNDTSTSLIETLINYGIRPDIPTAIVSECVLVYLDGSSIIQLIEQFSARFDTISWLTYDMVNLNDGFGKTMLKNIKASGIDLPGFVSYPTMQSQIERFLHHGWASAVGQTMLTTYQNLSEEEKHRINQIEKLDEWEEWNLLLDHYSFVLATKNIINLSL